MSTQLEPRVTEKPEQQSRLYHEHPTPYQSVSRPEDPFVTHSFSAVGKGAPGVLKVIPEVVKRT